MKTRNYLALALLMAGAINNFSIAQVAEKKMEKGQVKLILKEDKNGTVTKFDSTFSIEDKEKVHELLRTKGIEWDIDELDSKRIQKRIIMNYEDLDGEEMKSVKIIELDSDQEHEGIDIELIIKEALNEAETLKSDFQFDSNGENSNVFIMKSGDSEIDGQEFKLKMDGKNNEKVMVKTFVIEAEEKDNIEEVITEYISNTMIFISKSKDSNEKESIDTGVKNLPLKIEDDKLENLEISKLKLYPNPTNGAFNMSFKSTKEKDILISITDTKGAMVYEKELKNFKGKFSEDFDLSNQEKGIYFFNINSGSEKESRKIIVQ